MVRNSLEASGWNPQASTAAMASSRLPTLLLNFSALMRWYLDSCGWSITLRIRSLSVLKQAASAAGSASRYFFRSALSAETKESAFSSCGASSSLGTCWTASAASVGASGGAFGTASGDTFGTSAGFSTGAADTSTEPCFTSSLADGLSTGPLTSSFASWFERSESIIPGSTGMSSKSSSLSSSLLLPFFCFSFTKSFLFFLNLLLLSFNCLAFSSSSLFCHSCQVLFVRFFGLPLSSFFCSNLFSLHSQPFLLSGLVLASLLCCIWSQQSLVKASAHRCPNFIGGCVLQAGRSGTSCSLVSWSWHRSSH
mmetsp:Transcript_56691/g.89780  ORF Transcript_56691/g.89780 Transcript_56691/m.89780 type:complete len:310 (+) Transcript_56691:214-1143(+)